MDDRMGEGLDPFCEDVTDEDITDRNVTDGDGTEERPVREYVLEDGVLTRADAAEEAGADAVESAQKRVVELEGELAAARADFYNYRQRVTKERQQLRRLVVDDTVTALLPVLDNLDRALAVPEDGSAKDVLVGVGMVRRQFLSALEEMGVGIIPAEGVPFDPALHDAVETVSVEEPEKDGMVLEELVRGYRTDEKVLRAAQVTVGKTHT